MNVKLNKAVGRIGTIVIAVLFSTLIGACVFYASLITEGTSSILPDLSASQLRILTIGTNPGNVSENEFIVPSFIGIISNGESLSSPNDQTVRNELLGQVKQYFLDVFNGEAQKFNFATETEKTKYLDELYSSQNAIYVKLYNDIPASSVIPFLSSNTIFSESFDFNFNSVFFLADENEKLYCVLHDKYGNVTLLYPKADITFSNDQLLAYNDIAGLNKFNFVEIEENKNRGMAYYFPMLSNSVSVNNITVLNFDQQFELSASSSEATGILKAFCFNPNNTKHYIDVNGAVGFVEDFGELKISKDGRITYVGMEGGILLSRYLETSGKDAYSFSDKLSAAEAIISSFDKNYLGKAAQIGLVSVSYDDESDLLTVGFKYFLDGIAINREKDDDIRLVFSDSALVEAKIYTLICERNNRVYADIPQKSAFLISKNTIAGKTVLNFSFEYDLLESEKLGNKKNVYYAHWMMNIEGNE